jgi:hypothetical protein
VYDDARVERSTIDGYRAGRRSAQGKRFQGMCGDESRPPSNVSPNNIGDAPAAHVPRPRDAGRAAADPPTIRRRLQQFRGPCHRRATAGPPVAKDDSSPMSENASPTGSDYGLVAAACQGKSRKIRKTNDAASSWARTQARTSTSMFGFSGASYLKIVSAPHTAEICDWRGSR